MQPPALTLYADWQERRRRSNELSEREAPVRVLDYLLERYEGDPAALRPPRFPVSGDVFLNRRAMLVHRYLSMTPKETIQTTSAAESKVSRILKRMKSQAAQEFVGPPAGGALIGDDSQNPSLFRIMLGLLEPPQDRLVPEESLYADPNDYYRIRLMSAQPWERADAAKWLAKSGTLDDVNLFLELLALPDTAYEYEDRDRNTKKESLRRELLSRYTISDEELIEEIVEALTRRLGMPVGNERRILEECAMAITARTHTT